MINLVAISGVYHIVNWEMDPWMALLWGVGQVSIDDKFIKMILKLYFLDIDVIDSLNVSSVMYPLKSLHSLHSK